jgi:Flp pilus assembly protein TadD
LSNQPRYCSPVSRRVKLDSENVEYVERVGDIDVMQQQCQAAETEYGHAVELDETDPDYHAALAGVLRVRGKTGEADREEARAKALRSHPTSGSPAANKKGQ